MQWCTPRSGHIYLKDALVLNQIKNKFSDFIFRVIVDCIYNLLVSQFYFQVCHRPENIIQKRPKLQEKCANIALYGYFSSWVFFCASFSFLRYGRFFIWLILMYMTSCMQNRTHTKSTISQNLKVAQKTQELKNMF